MAKNFKILYVAAEIKPFLNHSYVSEIVRKLPQAMQEKGIEIRILVPKFGCINERKNRLHEVVRLSGMNIPIGDDEKPLIINLSNIILLASKNSKNIYKSTYCYITIGKIKCGPMKIINMKIYKIYNCFVIKSINKIS